jgi:hypothetical protein
MVNELSGHCAPLKGGGSVGNTRLAAKCAFASTRTVSEFARLEVFREGSALM